MRKYFLLCSSLLTEIRLKVKEGTSSTLVITKEGNKQIVLTWVTIALAPLGSLAELF